MKWVIIIIMYSEYGYYKIFNSYAVERLSGLTKSVLERSLKSRNSKKIKKAL